MYFITIKSDRFIDKLDITIISKNNRFDYRMKRWELYTTNAKATKKKIKNGDKKQTPNDTKNFPYPKSPILSEKQVVEIYKTLETMPKPEELEDEEIKPVGLKLFNSGFTLYIVEADIACEGEEHNLQTQCYGYVKNEGSPRDSEWGYIDVKSYIEVGNPFSYFEKDLFFKDKFITSSGEIITKDENKNG